MIKNISVKLVNGVGIKLFRIPIREDEINKFNIHQIYKLFATKSVKEIWEHNDDNTKKIKLSINNYKDEIDWDSIIINSTEKEEAPAVNKHVNKEVVVKLIPKKNNSKGESNMVEFNGETFEEIVDDNYDPDMGIDPDKENDEDNKK